MAQTFILPCFVENRKFHTKNISFGLFHFILISFLWVFHYKNGVFMQIA